MVGRMEEEIVRVAQVGEVKNFPFLFLCISRILCGEDDLGASHVWRMMLRRRKAQHPTHDILRQLLHVLPHSLVVEGRGIYEEKESCFPPLSLHISTLENLDGSSSLAEVVYRSS